MTTKSKKTTSPTPASVEKQSPEDLQRLIDEAAQRLMAQQQEEARLHPTRCLTCWRMSVTAAKGTKPAPNIRCSDCYRTTAVYDPDVTVSRRLGLWGHGSSQFLPGCAKSLSQHLSVPIDALVDETDAGVDIERLSLAYDELRVKNGSGPARAPLAREIATAEAVRASDDRRRRRISLLSQKDNLTKAIDEKRVKLDGVLSALAEVEAEIAAEEKAASE